MSDVITVPRVRIGRESLPVTFRRVSSSAFRISAPDRSDLVVYQGEDGRWVGTSQAIISGEVFGKRPRGTFARAVRAFWRS